MSKPVLSIASIALLAGLTIAGSANAAYRCDNPATPIEKRACAAAAESQKALAHFVWRMRVIESLNFSDFVKDE